MMFCLSLFNYDKAALITQYNGCVLDYFDWESNYCAVQLCIDARLSSDVPYYKYTWMLLHTF